MLKRVIFSAAAVIAMVFIANIGTVAHANSKVNSIISEGHKHIGVPYVWGGTTPKGFDCSGFLGYIYGKNGVSLPRTTSGLSNAGKSVSKSQLKEGDIILFSTVKSGPSHAGVYTGGNKFLHASTSKGVMVSSLNESYWKTRYIGARRVVEDEESLAIEAAKQAASLAKSLQPYYTTNISTVDDVEISANFLNDYNATNAALNKAENLTKSIGASSLSELDVAKEYKLRAARFIDAVKTGNDLDAARGNLSRFINSQTLNDDMVNAYNFLSSEIRRAERAGSRVYSADSRSLVTERFVTPSKIVKETVIYEVSRYNLMKVIEKNIANQEWSEVESNLAMLKRLERRSIDIKADGNKIHPGQYPDFPAIEQMLQTQKAELVAKYESEKQ